MPGCEFANGVIGDVASHGTGELVLAGGVGTGSGTGDGGISGTIEDGATTAIGLGDVWPRACLRCLERRELPMVLGGVSTSDFSLLLLPDILKGTGGLARQDLTALLVRDISLM